MTLEEHAVPRSGRPPLRFSGELLAEASGFLVGGQEQNRWHDLAVYRTAAGKFLLSIAFRTRWQGETDHFAAVVLGDGGAVAGALADYDPLAHLQGYPEGKTYREKQRRLEDNVCRRYRATVTELYDALPAEWFAERVD